MEANEGSGEKWTRFLSEVDEARVTQHKAAKLKLKEEISCAMKVIFGLGENRMRG